MKKEKKKEGSKEGKAEREERRKGSNEASNSRINQDCPFHEIAIGCQDRYHVVFEYPHLYHFNRISKAWSVIVQTKFLRFTKQQK